MRFDLHYIFAALSFVFIPGWCGEQTSETVKPVQVEGYYSSQIKKCYEK
jgi:hypothetical protein